MRKSPGAPLACLRKGSFVLRAKGLPFASAGCASVSCPESLIGEHHGSHLYFKTGQAKWAADVVSYKRRGLDIEEIRSAAGSVALAIAWMNGTFSTGNGEGATTVGAAQQSSAGRFQRKEGRLPCMSSSFETVGRNDVFLFPPLRAVVVLSARGTRREESAAIGNSPIPPSSGTCQRARIQNRPEASSNSKAWQEKLQNSRFLI